MGLKQVHFVDWLNRRFPRAIRPISIRESAQFDSVFIDVNCILHPAVRSSKNESEFVKRLFLTLDKLLRQCVPVRCCYLSVDSSAPWAKLALQKDRRRTKGSKTRTGRMSTLQITPGCPFMTRLEHYLDYYAVRYLQQYQGKGISPDLKFIIDHANNPGEGECKIVENIRQQKDNIRSRPCALISLDSDTILQALALGIPNMYVVRKEKSKQHVCISIDHLVKDLEDQFASNVSGGDGGAAAVAAARARLDFCVICMFRGNDYLRGMPVGIDRLWNSYIFTKTKDTTLPPQHAWLLNPTDKCFDLVFLRQLMKNVIKMPKTPNRGPLIVQQQPNLLRNATLNSAAASGRGKEEREQEEEDEEDEDSDEGTEMTTDMDEDSDSSDSECDTSMVEDDDDEETPRDPHMGGRSTPRFSVERYLQALLWNMEFYTSGICPDISFVYGLQVAPRAADIVAYINNLEAKSPAALQSSAVRKHLGVPTSNEEYPSPLVCAVMVTPLESGAKYLPASVANIHSTIDDKGSILQPGRMDEIDEEVRKLIAGFARSRDPKDAREATLLQTLYQKQVPHIWTRTRPGVMRRSTRPLPKAPSDVMAILHEAAADAGATTTVAADADATTTVAADADATTTAATDTTTTAVTTATQTLATPVPASPTSAGSPRQGRAWTALKEQRDIACLLSFQPPFSQAQKEVKPLKRYPWMDAKQQINQQPKWPFFPTNRFRRQGAATWGRRPSPVRSSASSMRSTITTTSSSSMTDAGAGVASSSTGPAHLGSASTTTTATTQLPDGSKHIKDKARFTRSGKDRSLNRFDVLNKTLASPSTLSQPQQQSQQQQSQQSQQQPEQQQQQQQQQQQTSIPVGEEKKVDLVAMLQASMARFQQEEQGNLEGTASPPLPSHESPRPVVEPAAAVVAPCPPVQKPLPQIQANRHLKAFVPLSVQSSLAAQRAKGSKKSRGDSKVPHTK